MLPQQNLQVKETNLYGPVGPAQRLVVLVPEQEVDEVSFGRAVCALAEPRRPEILLVAIVNATEQELSSRRRLATIASYLRELQFSVVTRVQRSKSWLQALGDELRPGDVLVYPPEVSLRDGLFKQISMEAALSPLQANLYPLPGFFLHTISRPWRRVGRGIAYWTGLALTLALFFALESAVGSSITGILGHIITVVLVFAEFGAAFLWTALFG